jgi:hypothetical protein
MILIRARSTLYLSDPSIPYRHLWLVLTDPISAMNSVVAVMLRTVHSYTDATLILNPGDHPFVRHDSCVHYSTAKLFSIPKIQSAITLGKCHLREDMSIDLLTRVRKGLLESPYTVNAIREYCRPFF